MFTEPSRVAAALIRLAAAISLAVTFAEGQSPAVAPVTVPAAADGSNLTVYLLTLGQGDDVWEKFGHNAIWIHDPAAGTDLTYNWGMFSFDEPQFIRRFLSGHTHYWADTIPLPAIMQEYRARNRTVLAQELNLTAAERLELERFLEWNIRPENRFYRYDYFRDNCSTRVRDAIDRVLSGRIRRATDSIGTKTSYRSHTARLTADNLPLYTGIMLALGHRADRPLSAWEEMFLPVPMAASLRGVRLAAPNGAQIPLVRSERELFTADRAPERDAPPNYVPLFLAIGLGLSGVLIYLVRAGEAGSRPASFTAGAVATAWSFLSGFFGLVVVSAWLLTEHVFMGRNENLLQFNPLSLAVAVTIPFTIAGGKLTRGVTRLATAIALLSLVGFVMQGVPGWNQKNGEIIALAMPLNLAVAWTVYRLGHYRRIARSSSADL